MNQSLNPDDWPAIRFEGELLPQSVRGITILIGSGFTEETDEFVWRLPHCKGVWKEGESGWCIASATEIIDHLVEYRDDVTAEIQERLGPHGFEGDATINEWLNAMRQIQRLASRADGFCRWIASEPTERAEKGRRRFLDYLDSLPSPEE